MTVFDYIKSKGYSQITKSESEVVFSKTFKTHDIAVTLYCHVEKVSETWQLQITYSVPKHGCYINSNFFLFNPSAFNKFESIILTYAAYCSQI